MSEFNLGTARGTIELDYNGNDAADDAADDIASVGAAGTSATEALQKVSTGAIVAGGGIVAGFAVAVNAAANFEKGMSGIQAVSGASTAEMDTVRKKALQLGADTAFSASEAGTAIEELVKAGISIPDVMNGAADATVALASAGGIALPEAAEIAANSMNQFGLAAKDMPNIANKIAGAANASAIDVTDFGMSLKQVGAVADLAGVSFDDTAVAIAEMGQAGIKGSDAGTSLKSFLSNLIPTTEAQINKFQELGFSAVGSQAAMDKLAKKGIKPVSKSYDDVSAAMAKYVEDSTGMKVGTGKNNKAVQELGMSTGALQNQFFDASGKAKSLKDMQVLLADKTKNMSKEQKLATFNMLFGSDAIRAAAIMAKNGAAGYDKMSAAINKTKAADVAKTRLANLAGQTEALKGSMETLAIQIGSILLPFLNSLVGKITAVVNWFGNLDEGTKKTIVIVALVVAGMLLFIGVAIKIALAVQSIRATVIALNTTWLALPIFWVIAAIIALIAIFVILYKNNETFRNIVDAVWQKVKDVIAGVVSWITGTAVPFLIAAWAAISAGAQALWAKIVAVWNAIVLGITTAVNAVKSTVSAVFAAIVLAVTTYVNLWRTIITTVFNAIKTTITTILNAIKTAWEAVWGLFGPLVLAVWNLIAAIIGLAIRAVLLVIRTVLNAIKAVWTTVWNGITAVATTVWNAISRVIITVFNVIKAFITRVINGIKFTMVTVWNAIRAVTSTVWNAIKTALTGPFNAAKEFVLKIVNALKLAVTTAWNAIKSVTTTVWNAIKAALTGPINSAKATISTVVNTIKTNVSTAFNAAKAAATTAFNGLRDAVGGAIETAKSKVSTAIAAIRGFFDGAGTWLTDAGRKLIGGLVQGIKDSVGAVTGAITSITDKIKGFLPGSPIEEGPLLKWNRKGPGGPGALLVDFLAKGIAGNLGSISDAFSNMDIGMPTVLGGADLANRGSALRTGVGGGANIPGSIAPAALVGGDLILQATKDQSVESQFDSVMFRLRTTRGVA